MSLPIKLFKGIKETISQTPQFQEFAQKIINLKPILNEIKANHKGQRDKLVYNVIEETINDPKALEIDSFGYEMKKFLLNSGVFKRKAKASRIFEAPLDQTKTNYPVPVPRYSEETYDLLNTHPRFKKKIVSEESKEKLRIVNYKRSKEERLKNINAKNIISYTKEGGTRDRYLKIKEYMDQGMDIVSATQAMTKDFNLGRTSMIGFYDLKPTQKSRIRRLSIWDNKKDLMKKYDPELYNFFNKKINQYKTDLDKTKKENYSKLSEKEKIDLQLNQGKNIFLTKLRKRLEDLNLFPKRIKSQKDPPTDALDQEHIMDIGGRRKMYFDPRYEDYYEDRIARLYKKPSYLTTRERNESIKKKLANKIINSENIKNSIIKDFEAGDMTKEDFISEMSIQNSRINMLNSEMKDQGLELGLFDPVTKEETFYGGQYDNILDLVKSEKEGVVPLKSDVVGPPKKLKSVDEVEKLKNGGLLNIEEVLNSD